MIRDENHPDHALVAEGYRCEQRLGFSLGQAYSPSEEFPAVYTLGLIKLDHPEFIVMGLPPEAARLLLYGLGRQVVHDRRYFHPSGEGWAVEADSVCLDDGPPRVRLLELSLFEEHLLFPDGLDRIGWEDGPPCPMLRLTFENADELKPMRFTPSAIANGVTP